MATGPITQLADIVEPTLFTAYTQQMTEQKSRLIQSGALMIDPFINELLAGGGLTFNVPSFRDLDPDDENVSTETAADIQTASFENGTPTDANRGDATPKKTAADTEVAVRLSRNQHWSASDLSSDIAGADPMSSIGSRVATYWSRRLQLAFINTVRGVFADNTANDSGDMTYDLAGSAAFADGVTNFSAEAFLDAALTMGDSQDDLAMAMVHSVVYNRMQKNNLIDFIPDARGETQIATFLGREVITDDSLPRNLRADTTTAQNGNFDTWMFAAAACRLGVGSAKVPTEVHRQPLAGGGGGQEVLSNRVQWSIHPNGFAYTGATSAKGGPTNATLAAAASWNRVFPERKQIKIARLVTRESGSSTGSGGIVNPPV